MTFEEIFAEEKKIVSSEKNRKTLPSPNIDTERLLPIGLPNLQETKQRISTRGSLIDELKNVSDFKFDVASRKAKNPVIKGLLRANELITEVPIKGARTILTGLQMAESAVSSSLLAGLEGKPENMISEFIKGGSGNKATRMADLFRAAGAGGTFAGEAAAEIGGFLTTLGIGNLVSAGAIGKGAVAMRQSLKQASKTSLRKKGFFFKDQAQQFVKGFDDAFSNMRGEYDKLYSKINNVSFGGDDVIALQDAIVSLPKDIASKISKLKGANFLDKSQRLLSPNVQNAKLVKDQISRTIPKNVWNGLDDGGVNAEKYRAMKESYFKLNDVIANNAGALKPKLLELNKEYSNLFGFSDKLSSTFRNKSGLIKTTIRNYKSEANQGVRDELIKFSEQFFKRGERILSDVDKLNRSLALKKAISHAAERAGPIAAGGAVAGGVTAGLLRKPVQSLGGGQSQGGG